MILSDDVEIVELLLFSVHWRQKSESGRGSLVVIGYLEFLLDVLWNSNNYKLLIITTPFNSTQYNPDLAMDNRPACKIYLQDSWSLNEEGKMEEQIQFRDLKRVHAIVTALDLKS